MVEIGALDASNAALNLRNQSFADGTGDREYERRVSGRAARDGAALWSFSGGPRVAFYGLGRLGTGGVDYGSDLDILITYDSLVPSPVKTLTQDEAYARLVELMIAALSSITREGYLYRVDLRLRPHGKNGPLVTSSEGFLDYLKEQSAPWEWLAYVKLRCCRRRSGTRKDDRNSRASSHTRKRFASSIRKS